MNDLDFNFFLLLWFYGTAIMILSVILFQVTGLFIFSILLILGSSINLFAYRKLKDEFSRILFNHLRSCEDKLEDEC